MIKATSVCMDYGDRRVLDGISFEVGGGEVVGLLGPNGAGKTTLLRILTGFFEASEGEVEVGGVNVADDPRGAQALIGYLPEQTPLYPEMLVQEALTTTAELRGMFGPTRRRLISQAVWATDLSEHLTRPILELSKGFRQRVGLAQAILHEPRVLVLDEPTSGLDPTQVVHVRQLIRRLSDTTTVLFSTHVLSEVEAVCERAVILIDGKVQADARLADLRATQRAVIGVRITPGEPAPRVLATAGAALGDLAVVEGVRELPGVPGYVRFEIDGAERCDLCLELFRAAQARGWELGELRAVVRDLESVFRELVERVGPSLGSDWREAS